MLLGDVGTAETWSFAGLGVDAGDVSPRWDEVGAEVGETWCDSMKDTWYEVNTFPDAR